MGKARRGLGGELPILRLLTQEACGSPALCLPFVEPAPSAAALASVSLQGGIIPRVASELSLVFGSEDSLCSPESFIYKRIIATHC